MREPKINDAWRRITEKEEEFSASFNTLKIDELGMIRNQNISFNGQIIAICGKNGVGKSTLLNAIIAILKPNEYFENNIRKKKIENSIFDLDFTNHKGENFNVAFSTLQESSQNHKAIIIDPPSECIDFIKMFSETQNIEELLAPLSPKFLKKSELTELNYILGKNIKSCKIYEVELNEAGRIFPYFKIEVDEEEYGIELMGLGEMAAIYIYWNLIIAEKNSFLLLEEPETFLSYTSQEHLVNVIAEYTYKKKLSTLMTTHSHAIINKIPSSNIVYVSRNGNNVNTRTNVRKYDYLKGLGMRPEIPYVFCVEDEVAKLLLMKLFNKFKFNAANDYVVFAVGGVENVKGAIGFPNLSIVRSKIIGVFDADQRGKITRIFHRPFVYLPGRGSPEEQLFDFVNKDVEYSSELMGIDLYKLSDALSRLEGIDHHDWFVELSREIGISEESFIDIFINGMIEKTQEIYNEFVEEIRILCDW